MEIDVKITPQTWVKIHPLLWYIYPHEYIDKTLWRGILCVSVSRPV